MVIWLPNHHRTYGEPSGKRQVCWRDRTFSFLKLLLPIFFTLYPKEIRKTYFLVGEIYFKKNLVTKKESKYSLFEENLSINNNYP